VDEQFRRVILTRATTQEGLHAKATAVMNELEQFRPVVLNDDGGDMSVDGLERAPSPA
jgi:hypothetical protein